VAVVRTFAQQRFVVGGVNEGAVSGRIEIFGVCGLGCSLANLGCGGPFRKTGIWFFGRACGRPQGWGGGGFGAKTFCLLGGREGLGEGFFLRLGG